MKFSIIIPCFNERANIDNLIERIRPLQSGYNLEYILIENGSSDDSKLYFKNNIEGKFNNIKIVYVEKNRGYGYGLQQGLKVATGDYIGWIHADLQMAPEEILPIFDWLLRQPAGKEFFIKGRRTNRRLLDNIFTFLQSIVNSIMFRTYMYDIGAIPVLMHSSLINKDKIDEMPNDFSIELFVYKEAILKNYEIKRFLVTLQKRDAGVSSWNRGIKSKFKQSLRIFSDSIKILKGEKVL